MQNKQELTKYIHREIYLHKMIIYKIQLETNQDYKTILTIVLYHNHSGQYKFQTFGRIAFIR